MEMITANIHTTKNIIKNFTDKDCEIQSVFVRLIDIIEKQQLKITQLETNFVSNIEFQANRITAMNMKQGL